MLVVMVRQMNLKYWCADCGEMVSMHQLSYVPACIKLLGEQGK